MKNKERKKDQKKIIFSVDIPSVVSYIMMYER